MSEAIGSLASRARDIFERLDYDVSGTGRTFHASRGWKRVLVEPVSDGDAASPGDALTCFVAWDHEAASVLRSLRPDGGSGHGEWALVAVAPDGDYEVLRTP